MNPTFNPKQSCDIEKEDKGARLAKSFGFLQVEELLEFPFIKEKTPKIPYPLAKKWGLLPLDFKEGSWIVALYNPDNFEAMEDLKKLLSPKIIWTYAPLALVEEALEKCYEKSLDETASLIEESFEKGNDDEEAYDLLAGKESASTVKILNMILLEAVMQGASDIHFEPQENKLGVRYRIDGVLQNKHLLAKEMISQLITRIKVMSKLDIAEHRLPQDGRIKLKVSSRSIDFRVSTVPVAYGERIVMRILDKGNIALGLDQIGMQSKMLQAFKKHLSQSQGIILVTGPTGSGKTTTLYSAISEIFSPEINIMTIEDPVEYKLAGIAQIGVNPKIELHFSTGLRHILRQDPDVIMVGEIRDKETAEIAIQASLTGHLVLSTLHTNDAPSALTRLVDMGIEPYLLTSSVIAVVAQRLVRAICPFCKVPYEPSKIELDDLQLTQNEVKDRPFYKGVGCSHCFGSGYKGRKGIYELMEVSYGIKAQLLKTPDAMQLQKRALEEGMSTLRAHGAELTLQGQTTAQEVIRVTKQIQLEDL